MAGQADSFNRVSNKIIREQRPVAVLAYAGRVMATVVSQLPAKVDYTRLVGIYDATLATFSEEALDEDLVYAERYM